MDIINISSQSISLACISWKGFPGGTSGKESACQCRKWKVWSLGWEDPLKKEMATFSSILAWEIPQTEEPGRLQFSSVQSLSCVWLFANAGTLVYLCPWDYPGKNTRVGCHFLLQGIFPTQGSNPSLLHWQVDSSPLSYPGTKLSTLLYFGYVIYWNMCNFMINYLPLLLHHI